MTDREKVIEGLSDSLKNLHCGFIDGVGDVYAVSDETIKNIIAMLKEQDAVTPVLDERTGRIWLCGNCRSYVGFEDNDPHDPNEFDKYCRECGRRVLWEWR